MTAGAGMRGRILAIGIACGVLGVGVITLTITLTSRSLIRRSTAPQLAWLMDHGEQARCEVAPETWRLVGPGGAQLWAYDGDTLQSRNPAAPPLSDAMRAELASGSDALELDGIGKGGVVGARGSAAHGACAVMTSAWPPTIGTTRLVLFFVIAGVIAGAVGAAISSIASARPLRELDKAHAEIAARRDQLHQQIADVAHDVRTPIASLQLALEQAIGASGDPPAVEACLVRAVHDVMYVGGLVGNLRLASELRAGAVTTAGRATLSDIVERAALRAQFLARQKHIALAVAVPETPLDVAGDPIAIAQAVGNVIDNAVAHGFEHGHVAVVLELAAEGRFELSIVDDGPGVEPGELPRLGERTFRTDTARRRDSRGRGLGLAITGEVCRQLGWTVDYAREEPRGLRVTIRGTRASTAATTTRAHE